MKNGTRIAATLTLHGMAEVGPKNRRDIAKWLWKQAAGVEKCGSQYSGKMTARFYWLVAGAKREGK